MTDAERTEIFQDVILADPGGRTAAPHGLKNRFTEWSRPLEPRCRKQDFGAVASRDDRM